MKLNNVRTLGLSFALCLSFAVAACGSDDDNPKPNDSGVVTGGSSGDGGAGGSGGSGGNTSGGAGGTDAGGAGGSGSGGTSTTNGVGGSAGAPTTDTGGAGGSGDTGGGSGGSGGTGLPECEDPTEEECFDLEACSPTEEAHVLNQCTESDCFAYDNEANLPLYNGGDLPPVP